MQSGDLMKRRLFLIILISFNLAVIVCAPAWAQTQRPTPNAGDTAWILTSSALVLMMSVPGLALYYAGLLRRKNMLAMLMQIFFTTALVTVLWFVVGYSLVFTQGSGGLAPVFGGFSRLLLTGSGLNGLSGTIPETVFAFFQCTFAIITPALALGGPADRLKFSASMIFVGIWLLLVYCPVAHMVWGPNGFLAGLGVLDFAGGTVVHINSAVAGLVAALMVGKRSFYGRENMAPGNMAYVMIGGALLWVGWFGFNAGSAGTAGGLAGMAAINTQLATAAAVLSWVGVEWVVKGKPSLLGAISGAISGLVAITPACGFVPVGGALVIGLAAGGVCFWGVTGFKAWFGYDDAMDVWGVHGLGGILGALLTGVFAVAAVGGAGHSGLIDGNPRQILIQAEGVMVTILYDAIVTYLILKLIDLTLGLRVSKEAELEGLDITQHGEAIQHGA